MQMKLEYIVEAIKALRAAESVLIEDEFIPRAKVKTECLMARVTLEAAIGSESIAVLEGRS